MGSSKKKGKKKFDFEAILNLAEIDIPEEEKESFRKDVEKIIEFVETISELPLEDVEPTTWRFEGTQRLREDIPKKFENVGGIIKNFPKKKDRFAVVPQVVDSEE